jgi:UDP-N-acetyl-D-glucosamine dehydrogenase
VDDARETPAAEIIEHLLDQGADVTYHDPHIAEFPPMRKHKLTLKSQPLTASTLKGSDCVLIVTDHDAVDYALVGREAKLVVDTRNAMARVKGEIKARLVRA